MPPRILALGLLVPLLAACAATVPESGEVACDEDLEAEVGATMECMATIDGVQRGLTLEVTKVEDDTAEWKVDVAE
jgi:hypothetical protein